MTSTFVFEFADFSTTSYDQNHHGACMHFDVEDDIDEDSIPSWPKLESVLSVWIEMIQRQKVVAIPAEVGAEEWKELPEGGFGLVQGPKQDPLTGARRIYRETAPWTMQSYTTKDVIQTLQVWDLLISAIEELMDLPARAPDDPSLPCGLYTPSELDAAHIPAGFAREFLSRCRRPRFEHIAPGLRIAKPAEFAAQQEAFFQLHTANAASVPRDNSAFDDAFGPEVMPILLFRAIGNATVSGTSPGLSFPYPYGGPQALSGRVQCGLYLDHCSRWRNTPFEDGFRFVLPFVYDGLNGYARQADGNPVEGHDGLLQLGHNLFNELHPTPLAGFLEVVLSRLQDGHWRTDTQGVAGSIDTWREADLEEHFDDFMLPQGPGSFW